MQFRIAGRALLLPLTAVACVSTSTFAAGARLRPAVDPPDQFVTEDGAAPAAGSCRSPLIDPRDQTRLQLVRSGAVDSTEQGDYEVPAGRYGVATGELLRIACATGRPLGIVAR